MVEKTWGVYVLESTPTGDLYTGITTEPYRRVKEHNESKKGAKRTRQGRPWVLVYWEERHSRSDAMRRECEIKKLTNKQKLELMSKI